MRSYRSIGALAVTTALVAGAATFTGSGMAARPVPRAGAIVSTPSAGRLDVDDVQVWTRSVARVSSSGSSPGYAYLSRDLVGQTPAGFGIWVNPSARHHWVIGKYSSVTATALQRLGTKITYRGYGAPSAAEGVVRVLEGQKGCGNNGSTVGVTWTYWNVLPSGKEYVTHADVYLCPRLFNLGTWATQATVGHEIGHAMGLGHVSYRYLGSYQLMNPTVRRGLVTYRTGDKNGLARLARQTAAIRLDVPPMGKLEHSAFADGTIDFRGWALLKYFKSQPVTVVLTDNGQVVQTGTTSVLRPDVNASLDPGSRTHGYDFQVSWPGGRHRYCITATATDHPAASAQIGCVTWST